MATLHLVTEFGEDRRYDLGQDPGTYSGLLAQLKNAAPFGTAVEVTLCDGSRWWVNPRRLVAWHLDER